MRKILPSEIYNHRESDLTAVYAETYLAFEITVKQNRESEFIGCYNVVGYADGLMTCYKFDTIEKCVAYWSRKSRSVGKGGGSLECLAQLNNMQTESTTSSRNFGASEVAETVSGIEERLD